MGDGAPGLGWRSTCVDCSQCSLTAPLDASGHPPPHRVSGSFCRHPIRPVLKHGPRSLTCARVTGWQT